MNTIFSSEQKFETGNFDSNLIFHQYKLNLMAYGNQIQVYRNRIAQPKIKAKSKSKRFRSLNFYFTAI